MLCLVVKVPYVINIARMGMDNSFKYFKHYLFVKFIPYLFLPKVALQAI